MILQLKIGERILPLKMLPDLAPITCGAVLKAMPFSSQIIHGRWSGEACWVPMGNTNWQVSAENQKNEPLPGELLFYSQGISETEILFPYGVSRFACKDGALWGNHFATVIATPEEIYAIGRSILYEGVKQFTICGVG